MKLTKLKTQIIDSFWFWPVVIMFSGLILSELLILIETVGIVKTDSGFLHLGTDGSRTLLSTIGTAILGVASMSFSLTASTMATVSSSYGARLVRNFMNNTENQVILGIFSGTFLYALWTLRHIYTNKDGQEFVPSIAVYGAIMLAVVCVGALIYFINQIAKNIQISTLLDQVREDIYNSIKMIYPENEKYKNAKSIKNTEVFRSLKIEKNAQEEGYIQLVDLDTVVEVAKEQNIYIKLQVQPGDYVYKQKVILEISNGVDKEIEQKLLGCISIGKTRTPHQDIRFAFQQPVDIACRALSPGVNDPFTAIDALNVLEAGLVEYLRHGDRHQYIFDDDGVVRVCAVSSTREEVVREIMLSLDTYCHDDPRVKTRYAELKKSLKIT